MTTPVQTTPARLAETLHSAKPNLFGSILVRKPISLRKSSKEEAAKVIRGTLYKEYRIKGFATVKDYEKAVNNAKGRDEQEQDFQVSERKWGEHWNGSPIIIIHKERFYLQCRLTKKSTGESRFVDSMGNEVSYDTVEPFLLSKDKRETKKKSIEATAAHQGLDVEDSVQIRDVPIDTIVSLAYGGALYEVAPEAKGAVSAPAVAPAVEKETAPAVAETPAKAWTNMTMTVALLVEHDADISQADVIKAARAHVNTASIQGTSKLKIIQQQSLHTNHVNKQA